MGEIHFRADRLLLCECSCKKHIIPTHRLGVPEFYPPPPNHGVNTSHIDRSRVNK
jgi:hypothetical protein